MSEEAPIPGIDFALEGTIVDGAALDSAATRVEINAVYPPFPIQGPTNYPTPLLTIRTGGTKDAPEGVPVTIVDPNDTCLPKPGTWDKLIPPTPPPLQRPNIVGKVNTNVYMEGKLVPVSGDTVFAPEADDPLLELTGLTVYPTIIIGTQT